MRADPLSVASSAHSGWSAVRQHGVHALCAAMEAVLVVLVCLSPWAFGSVLPESEFVLSAGVALVLLLWAARMALECGSSGNPALWPSAWQACFFWACGKRFRCREMFWSRHFACDCGMYDRLLPAQPELISPAIAAADVHAASGRTISLYPQATGQMLLRILAVFALFAAVRNNLAGVGALRRLSIAVVVNGALLSLFGLVQFCTSAHNTLYWHVVSEGAVFGPFVDRDHFAFYINLCIGLGLGSALQPAGVEAAAAGRRFRLLVGPSGVALGPCRAGIDVLGVNVLPIARRFDFAFSAGRSVSSSPCGIHCAAARWALLSWSRLRRW